MKILFSMILDRQLSNSNFSTSIFSLDFDITFDLFHGELFLCHGGCLKIRLKSS